MDNTAKLNLSSSEIFVTAALLGYENVFGIDERLFSLSDISKKQIKQVVRKMEKKKLLRYDLDGTLYIAKELHNAIKCICDAETIALFSTNLKSGKKANIYVLENGENIAYLEKIDSNKYIVEMPNEFPLNEIIPYEIISSLQSDLSEKMLFEEATYIRKRFEAFEHEEAEQRLQKLLRNPEQIGTVAKSLSGNCGFMSVQIHKRGKGIYNAVFSSLVVAVDGQAIKIVADENDVLYFTSIDANALLMQIKEVLESKTERGAV